EARDDDGRDLPRVVGEDPCLRRQVEARPDQGARQEGRRASVHFPSTTGPGPGTGPAGAGGAGLGGSSGFRFLSSKNIISIVRRNTPTQMKASARLNRGQTLSGPDAGR